ncbi:hypothetical protein ACQ7DA_09840 [Zafaria sp. J156]|uniref:hypothetical protein n=1 Tax=Zafaria sp. J156 TaxID=3116490 RepID=UPI002E766148|nr:hypothetical protein [Zafaria sp. J156]MEE1621872.1 hypothetical protein [Zafaria sp. J156]
MSLFKRNKSARAEAKDVAQKDAPAAAPPQPIYKYRINEELANRLAMRAYGDANHDGKPDIPRVPYGG